MLSTITYSVLLLCYLLILWLTPRRNPAPGDRQVEGEEAFLRLVFLLSLGWLVSLSLPFFVPPLQILPPLPCAIAGVLLFLLGVGVRTIAVRTLGSFFTHKLTVKQDQRLITTGIYRYLRHPSYTGTLLQFVGLMVAARSWAGMLGLALSGGTVIALRIYREERLLQQFFGQEYRDYSRHTKRLLPWIF